MGFVYPNRATIAIARNVTRACADAHLTGRPGAAKATFEAIYGKGALNATDALHIAKWVGKPCPFQAQAPLPAEGRALHRAEAGRLLLQVHDELIFEVAAAHAPRLRELVRHAMEGAAALRVPLFVKVQQGPAWGELSEVEASSA